MPREAKRTSKPRKQRLADRAARQVARPRDYALASLFLVFWLLPISYRGATKDRSLYPWMPRGVNTLFNVSCLFTYRPEFNNDTFLQATQDGQSWFTLPDADYFPMMTFGYVPRYGRTLERFQRFLPTRNALARQERELERINTNLRTAPGSPPLQQQQRALMAAIREGRAEQAFLSGLGNEMATWIRGRHLALHPTQEPLQGVRFVRTIYPVGEQTAYPDGHWPRTPPEECPPSQVSVDFEILFEGGGGI